MILVMSLAFPAGRLLLLVVPWRSIVNSKPYRRISSSSLQLMYRLELNLSSMPSGFCFHRLKEQCLEEPAIAVGHRSTSFWITKKHCIIVFWIFKRTSTPVFCSSACLIPSPLASHLARGVSLLPSSLDLCLLAYATVNANEHTSTLGSRGIIYFTAPFCSF